MSTVSDEIDRKLEKVRGENNSLIKTASKTGPGTELHTLLTECGIVESLVCNCQSYANFMNHWGYDGCVQRREEIVSYLFEKAREQKLDIKLVSGVAYVVPLLILLQGQRAVCGWFVDEALERTRKNATK